MKKYILGAILIVSQISVFAQKNQEVLFRINEEPTYVYEFNELFNTNRPSLVTNNFDENLKLMVDYKLKLKAAKAEGIDTIPSLIKEFQSYKKSIVSSYISDDKMLEELVKEAYERTINQVKASHLLIMTTPNDTLKAFNKIRGIKKQIDSGADFTEMALKYSDDKSVIKNKGELGAFNAFAMVYPFESAAFNTPVGQVSKIVKTRFGYHLIKVTEKSKTGAKVNVAHIMIAGLDADQEDRIKLVHEKLKDGSGFNSLAKKYSEDKGTARKGGVLKPFGKGVLPKPFEDAAFSLEKKNPISKPFKTQYGWHIVKFIKKEPIQSFEEMKEELKRKVMSDSQRKEVINKAAYLKVANKHLVVTNKEALKVFGGENPYDIPLENLQKTLLIINRETYSQKDFSDYIKSRRNKAPLEIYTQYKRMMLKNYITKHLKEENEELKKTLTTYKNGLVIFELMKKHVWDVSAKNPERVKKFYKRNLSKYKAKGNKFEDVKGFVESDYQDKVQKEWLAGLRSQSKIKYNKKEIKELKKSQE